MTERKDPPRSKLGWEKRGDEYVIARMAPDGRLSEIQLTETEVFTLSAVLGQMQAQIRESFLSLQAGRKGISARVANPIHDVEVAPTLLNENVLLQIVDQNANPHPFSLTVAQANSLAQTLSQVLDSLRHEPTKQ